MKNAKFSALLPFLLALAALGAQGCFYGGGGYRYPAYYSQPQPAYYPPRASYALPPPPPVYGAYDERHVWRDRNWWVQNRHQWVQAHHPAWLHAHG
jgi:hypothetical protein